MTIAKFQACYLPVLAAFAAKHDVRYYINGFYIEPAHPSVGGCYLIATDGHTVVVIHDPKAEAAAAGIFNVPYRLLSYVGKQKSKTAKAVGAVQVVHLDGRMATMTIGEAFAEHDVGAAAKQIDGKYPDVRRVLGFDWANLEKPDFISVNPAYLARLKKVARLDGKGTDRAVQIRKADGGALVCMPNLLEHKVFVVIMCMKDDAKGEPEWVTTYRTLDTADGWLPMSTAPKNASWITVRMADGTIHERAHWAEDTTGECQPPFAGWFIDGPGCFREIDTPSAWKPITEAAEKPADPEATEASEAA